MTLIVSPDIDRLRKHRWHETPQGWVRDGEPPVTLRAALAQEEREEKARDEAERRMRQAGEIIPPQVDTSVAITVDDDGKIVRPELSVEQIDRIRWDNKRRFGVA
jgi:hypothetical protein